MQSIDHFLQRKHSLTMDPEKWNRWKDAPGWFRDRFIALEYHTSPDNSWEIREAVITEVGYDGISTDEFFLSVLLQSGSTRPGEFETGVGRFYRPSCPGFLTLFDSSSIHRLQGKGPFHSIQINFTKSSFQQRLNAIVDDQTNYMESLQASAWQDKPLEILLKQVMNLTRQQQEYDAEDAIDRLLKRLLTLSGQKIAQLTLEDRLKPQSIQRVIDFIHANPTANHSRDDMARIAAVEPHHFSRLFHQTVGITPIRYLRNLRLEHAKHLLETSASEVTVDEIARECGFLSGSHLSQYFKSSYGVTPSQLRRF